MVKMKKILSRLFFKIAVKLVKWSVALEPLKAPQLPPNEVYSYRIIYTMEDGSTITGHGPVTLSEGN